jgi:uncharacterized protein (DUF983 family)
LNEGGRAQAGAAIAILLSRCPRCGKGSLFSGYLRQADACSVCGLDFSKLKVDDGPAAFAVFIVGFIVAGGALLLEVNYHPPYWVHAAIWGPAIVILTLVVLRPLKSWLAVMQYRNKAEEGRFE